MCFIPELQQLITIQRAGFSRERYTDALWIYSRTEALEAIDQAQNILAVATQGTQRPEAYQALALLAQTKEQLGQIYQPMTYYGGEQWSD